MKGKKISRYLEAINLFAPEFAHLTNEELLEVQKKMGLPRWVTEVCDGKKHFKIEDATDKILASRDCNCR